MERTTKPVAISLCLAALACGCTTGKRGKSADASEGAEPRRLAAISTAFDVLEVRAGSKSAVEPDSRLVDYESSVVVRPDKVALAELIPQASDADASLRRSRVEALDRDIAAAEALVARMGELAKVVDTIADYERAALDLYRDVEAGSAKASDPRYGELAERREVLAPALQLLASTYVEAVEVGAAIDWKARPDEGTAEDELLTANKAKRDAIYRRMAPPSQFQRNRFVASEVTAILNETTAALQAQLEKLQSAVAEKAPKAEVEMEAALVRDGERKPITIAPYTIVAGENRGAKSQRVGVPGKADAKRVRDGFEANAELSGAINGLAQTLGDEESRQALLDGAVAQLKGAADRLRDQLLADVKAVGEEEGPIPSARDAARALRDSLVGFERDLRAVLAAPDAAAKLKAALALVDELRGGRLKTLVGQFNALKDALPDVGDAVQTEADKIAKRLNAALEAEAASFQSALNDVPGGADVSKLIDSLKVLSELAHARAFAAVEPGAVTRRSLALDAAVDGYVDLANTEADDGDRLSLSYRVVVDPQSAATRREYPGSTSLEVRKFGLYTTLKSQLLFYDRRGDGSPTFRAAPGIAYNFHFRPEGDRTFFDVVAPGVGVSVSSPSYDSGADLAIGLQLTFFNDMLQAGYAHNISVDDDPGMLYFGLDLIGAFQAAR